MSCKWACNTQSDDLKPEHFFNGYQNVFEPIKEKIYISLPLQC